MREGNLNSRTTPKGVFRRPSNDGLLGRRRRRCAIARRARRASCRTPYGASLTSNSPRAPLRQANNDPIRAHPAFGWETGGNALRCVASGGRRGTTDRPTKKGNMHVSP